MVTDKFQEKDKKIREMLRSGASIKEIAKATGSNHAEIQAVRKEYLEHLESLDKKLGEPQKKRARKTFF